MKLEVANKLKNTFTKAKLSFKKHSPEILIAGGVIGVITSAVLACVATTKVGKVVNNAKEKIKVVHEKKGAEGENYTKKEVGKDLTRMIYILFSTTTAFRLLRLRYILTIRRIAFQQTQNVIFD